jgi:hypothetical protein
MRMKDEVYCRDQIQRGYDLCRQYKRRPNVELDDFYQSIIGDSPEKYEGELAAYDLSGILPKWPALNLLAASEADAAVVLSLRLGNAP